MLSMLVRGVNLVLCILMFSLWYSCWVFCLSWMFRFVLCIVYCIVYLTMCSIKICWILGHTLTCSWTRMTLIRTFRILILTRGTRYRQKGGGGGGGGDITYHISQMEYGHDMTRHDMTWHDILYPSHPMRPWHISCMSAVDFAFAFAFAFAFTFASFWFSFWLLYVCVVFSLYLYMSLNLL